MSDRFNNESSLGNELSSLDFWRLCDALTVVQAALLLAGVDPSKNDVELYVEERAPSSQPPKYPAIKTALEHAIRRSKLKAYVIYYSDPTTQNKPLEKYDLLSDSICWLQTSILVSDLKAWLSEKGICSGFFFPTAKEDADYLDPLHPRYAPKLAAAVRAWQAITEPKGKTPKTALMKWLRENASNFELTDAEGKVNESGIEECAKVANWEMKGGAPRTPEYGARTPEKVAPTKKETSTEPAKTASVKASLPQQSRFDIADDDIPF